MLKITVSDDTSSNTFLGADFRASLIERDPFQTRVRKSLRLGQVDAELARVQEEERQTEIEAAFWTEEHARFELTLRSAAQQVADTLGQPVPELVMEPYKIHVGACPTHFTLEPKCYACQENARLACQYDHFGPVS